MVLLVEKMNLGNGGAFDVVVTALKGTESPGNWDINTDLVLVSLPQMYLACTYHPRNGHYRFVDKLGLENSDAIGLHNALSLRLNGLI